MNGFILGKIFWISLVIVTWINCNQQNVEILNNGIGGNTTTDLIDRIENDVIAENPDIVILMIGTNDMVNSRKMIPYINFSSNLDTLISLFKDNNIDVVLVSPPPADTVYLFERHDKEKFMESPNKKLEAASKILKVKSVEYGLTFIDIFNEFKKMGIPAHNKDSLIRNEVNCGAPDGVHPTPQGYRVIAQQIFKNLVCNGKIKKNIKIVCIGDSITLGAHVTGEGTVSGETYPAFLKELICRHLKNNE